MERSSVKRFEGSYCAIYLLFYHSLTSKLICNRVTLTLHTYRDRFMVICVQLFEYALGKHEERIAEVDTFYDSINEAKEDNRKMGIAKIDNFIEYKAEVTIVQQESIHFLLHITRSDKNPVRLKFDFCIIHADIGSCRHLNFTCYN